MPNREPLLTRPFVVAFAGNLFHGMAFFLFIHLPTFLTDLGASATEVGVLVGVTAVSAIVIRPTLGRVMDTRGRRPVVLAGGVLNVATALLYLTVSSVGPWLFLVRILHGFGISMTFTALFTYGADIVPTSRRTEGLALFGVSGILPIALGGVVGEVVLAQADFKALFAVAAILAGVGLLVTLFLPETAPRLAKGESPGGFFAAVFRRELYPIWAVTTAFSMALTGYFTFLRTFVDETGIGSVGLFFSYYAGTAIALRLTLAWLPERVGAKRVLFPAFGLLILGFFVLAQAESATSIVVAGVLCGAGHAYTFPILMGMAVDRASDAGRGSAVAFFTALFDVGALLGGPTLGFVIEQAGYPTMFRTTGIFLGSAVAGFAVWERRLAKSAPAVETASPSVVTPKVI
ncbi:MAG: MFS transporter [bacterium]|nr:MFS transporter [bacterium]MCP4967500.1 MFS transporter [bacterium]